MNFAYKEDGVVTGLNRAGQGGELTGNCTPQELVHGMVAEYYSAPDGTLLAKSQAEIDILEFNSKKETSKLQVKQECQDHIYKYYPAPIQQSMALGIYPSEQNDVMVLFIASCVEYENTINDDLTAVTTEFQVDQIMANISWPTPEGM